jgi:translation initiation factor 2 alpha subunit (eIF-2alpha)
MNIQTLNIGDNVNVTINSIDDLGILVILDDYQCEGFVPLSEISRQRTNLKSVIKNYQIGGNYSAKIVRMDTTRRYFDLSFKEPPTKPVLGVSLSNNPVTVSLQ